MSTDLKEIDGLEVYETKEEAERQAEKMGCSGHHEHKEGDKVWYLERKDAQRNIYKTGETIETYKTREGIELALPIYYRNKLYSDDEKEKLWIEKLDKEERYVCGVKVDISEGEEKYYKLLENKRIINKRLGYGDDEVNWERKKYEQERSCCSSKK